MRLDTLLQRRYPTYSRTYFQHLIDVGAVLVNGRVVKKRTSVAESDQIDVQFLLPDKISLEPEEMPLDILYEDEHLLAINKSAGLVVHPAPGHASHTFVNALLHHCNTLEKKEGDMRPGIVHRLDKETSGVLLAAKTHLAHAALVQLFSNRKMEKKYLAICCGCPPEGRLTFAIARHSTRRKEMAVISEGKEAITECTVLKKGKELSLVELTLITGRTHQIRVHLKHVKCPVLGDSVYGSTSMNKKFCTARQLLHAHTLSFCHPFTGKALHLTAPIPKDFELINLL